MRLLSGSTAVMAAMLPFTMIGFTADAGDAGGGSGSTPPADDAGGKAAEKTTETTKTTETKPADTGRLSQDEVNAIVAREVGKVQQRAAKDAEDAAKWRKAEEAQASEIEKAERKGRSAGTEETTSKFHGVLVGAKAEALAAGAKFRDPAVALAMLQANGSLAAVTVTDDGTVDTKPIETALAALATSHPYLVDDGKTQTQTASGVGLGGAASTANTKQREPAPGIDRIRTAFGANDKTRSN